MLILQIIWFMLPAYVANMVPVFLTKVTVLNKPVNTALFGSHKTWKGLVFGTLAGTLVFKLQQYLYVPHLHLTDYQMAGIALGFLLSLGALLGDMIKSYFKRRVDIKSGLPWIPFDQLDYSIGAILFASPIVFLGWEMSFYIIALSFVLHLVINRIGYSLGIRKRKF